MTVLNHTRFPAGPSRPLVAGKSRTAFKSHVKATLNVLHTRFTVPDGPEEKNYGKCGLEVYFVILRRDDA